MNELLTRMSARAVVVTAAIVLVLFLAIAVMANRHATSDSDQPQSPQYEDHTTYTIPTPDHHWGSGS
jgi:hypothetical protein